MNQHSTGEHTACKRMRVGVAKRVVARSGAGDASMRVGAAEGLVARSGAGDASMRVGAAEGVVASRGPHQWERTACMRVGVFEGLVAQGSHQRKHTACMRVWAAEGTGCAQGIPPREAHILQADMVGLGARLVHAHGRHPAGWCMHRVIIMPPQKKNADGCMHRINRIKRQMCVLLWGHGRRCLGSKGCITVASGRSLASGRLHNPRRRLLDRHRPHHRCRLGTCLYTLSTLLIN